MVVRYLLFWFLLAVVAVANGVLRQSTYGNHVAELTAHQTSISSILAGSGTRMDNETPWRQEERLVGNREYCTISGVLFIVVAFVHFLRIIMGMSVQIDGYLVPMYASWIGFVVTGALAVWAFRVRSGRS